MLMSAAENGKVVKLWDLTDDMKSSLTPPSQVDQFIYSMAFSTDGTQLAVVSDSGLQVWNANNGHCLWTLEEWKGFNDISSITFCNDDILLARTPKAGDHVAEIWSVRTGTCLQSLADERISRILGLEFSPDSATLAMVATSTVSFWDVAEGSCKVAYRTPDSWVSTNHVKFSDTGSHLYPIDWEDGHDAIRWEGRATVSLVGIGVAPLEIIPARSGYSVQGDRRWVRKDGENVIWIPREHQTSFYATCGSMMALGHGSGRVIFLRFK